MSSIPRPMPGARRWLVDDRLRQRPTTPGTPPGRALNDTFAAGRSRPAAGRPNARPFAPLFDDLISASSPEAAKLDQFMQAHVADLLAGSRSVASQSGCRGLSARGAGSRLPPAPLKTFPPWHEEFRARRLHYRSAASHGQIPVDRACDVKWPSISAIVTLAKLNEAQSSGTPPDPALVGKARANSPTSCRISGGCRSRVSNSPLPR